MARVLPFSFNIESSHALVFAITYEEDLGAERRTQVELGAFSTVSALFRTTSRTKRFATESNHIRVCAASLSASSHLR